MPQHDNQQNDTSGSSAEQFSVIREASKSIRATLKHWDDLRWRSNHTSIARMPGPIGTMMRPLLRLRSLGRAWEIQAAMYDALAKHMRAVDDILSQLAPSPSVQA